MTAPAFRPLTRVPPPILFAVAFVLGWLLQRAFFASPSTVAAPLVYWVGLAAIAAGVLLAGWAVGLFARGRTTLIPHGDSSSLVLAGPYRFTRNPMYLSLSIIYLGAALLSGYWLAIPQIALPLLVLQYFVIPMEEAQLARRFGSAYLEFCHAVRRWL